jgi:hypothetical protein
MLVTKYAIINLQKIYTQQVNALFFIRFIQQGIGQAISITRSHFEVDFYQSNGGWEEVFLFRQLIYVDG